ncbi:unnamed protein product [Protopolystoma xenopodis]|uniref:Uncharacterized protein n=1 Tax=Protopolystoma xenopodis TaxID=117903 RepID=A0A3S5C6J0_9PLAT|nr:unnamed protein product [Protopolystoma xenopodis]
MNLPDVRHMTDESLAPFHRNRGRLPRKPRQHESSRKLVFTGTEGDCLGNSVSMNLPVKPIRQLVKRNSPSSSGGTDLRISSPNTALYMPPPYFSGLEILEKKGRFYMGK